MKTVLIINQKGGVGKTTLADEIAFALERETKKDVGFISVDPQGGTVHSFNTLNKDTNAEYQVVDTPGVLDENLNVWVENADIVLIPLMASTRDLEPSLRTYEVACSVDKDIPIFFVMNCFNAFGKMDNELLNYMRAEEFPVAGTIPRSVLFSQAAANNESAYTMRFAKERGICSAIDSIVKLIKEA